MLRNWIPELNSDGYKIKIDIVDEFENQGIDYWSTEIPESVYVIFKKKYPDNWQELIEKYWFKNIYNTNEELSQLLVKTTGIQLQSMFTETDL